MTTEKTSQGWRVSAIHGGRLVSKLYLGYSKREAEREFRTHLKTLT